MNERVGDGNRQLLSRPFRVRGCERSRRCGCALSCSPRGAAVLHVHVNVFMDSQRRLSGVARALTMAGRAWVFGVAGWCSLSVLMGQAPGGAAQTPPVPTPPGATFSAPRVTTTTVPSTNRQVIARGSVIQGARAGTGPGVGTGASVPVVPGVGGQGGVVTTPPDALVWATKEKTYNALPGETSANFRFALTNRSSVDVTVHSVRPSCGCTAAKLPKDPWILAPGTGGELALTVDLHGKTGRISKSATVYTSSGQSTLLFHVNIPPPTATGTVAGGRMAGDRQKNLQLAAADRQAVFKGDCVSCHVTPAIGKKGKGLYDAACGICHEGDHRASFVPNLRGLNKPTNPQYWQSWITYGREGSLMPAFAKSKEGPLEDEQIQSLVEYLETDFKLEVVDLRPSATAAPLPPLAPPFVVPAPASAGK